MNIAKLIKYLEGRIQVNDRWKMRREKVGDSEATAFYSGSSEECKAILKYIKSKKFSGREASRGKVSILKKKT